MKIKTIYFFKKQALLAVLVMFMLPNLLFSQSSVNEKFLKTVYIEKFARYITWPTKAWESFNVGVLNDKAFYDEFSKNYKTRPINGKQVNAFQIKDLKEIANCDVLFVSKDYGNDIEDILERCNKNSVLLVGEYPDLCKRGAHINFVISESKNIYFEINTVESERANLKFKSKLLENAINVRNSKSEK